LSIEYFSQKGKTFSNNSLLYFLTNSSITNL
jgi:hypothetical protein